MQIHFMAHLVISCTVHTHSCRNCQNFCNIPMYLQLQCISNYLDRQLLKHLQLLRLIFMAFNNQQLQLLLHNIQCWPISYDLLKDENTNEVNCEADFQSLAFRQKCTIHKRILNFEPVPLQWFISRFSNKSFTFSGISHSTISVHSTFLSITFNLLVAFYLQATHIHAHI